MPAADDQNGERDTNGQTSQIEQKQSRGAARASEAAGRGQERGEPRRAVAPVDRQSFCIVTSTVISHQSFLIRDHWTPPDSTTIRFAEAPTRAPLLSLRSVRGATHPRTTAAR